jgi:hypothetical protein
MNDNNTIELINIKKDNIFLKLLIYTDDTNKVLKNFSKYDFNLCKFIEKYLYPIQLIKNNNILNNEIIIKRYWKYLINVKSQLIITDMKNISNILKNLFISPSIIFIDLDNILYNFIDNIPSIKYDQITVILEKFMDYVLYFLLDYINYSSQFAYSLLSLLFLNKNGRLILSTSLFSDITYPLIKYINKYFDKYNIVYETNIIGLMGIDIIFENYNGNFTINDLKSFLPTIKELNKHKFNAIDLFHYITSFKDVI